MIYTIALLLFAQRDGLAIGDIAPTFKLAALDGGSKIELRDQIKKKPLVLVFGSCT